MNGDVSWSTPSPSRRWNWFPHLNMFNRSFVRHLTCLYWIWDAGSILKDRIQCHRRVDRQTLSDQRLACELQVLFDRPYLAPQPFDCFVRELKLGIMESLTECSVNPCGLCFNLFLWLYSSKIWLSRYCVSNNIVYLLSEKYESIHLREWINS